LAEWLKATVPQGMNNFRTPCCFIFYYERRQTYFKGSERWSASNVSNL
jgi:hypothetical protein